MSNDKTNNEEKKSFSQGARFGKTIFSTIDFVNKSLISEEKKR